MTNVSFDEKNSVWSELWLHVFFVHQKVEFQSPKVFFLIQLDM